MLTSSDLPKYIMQDTDRRGNVRLYFRRGKIKIRPREEIGSAGFDAHYEALSGAHVRPKTPREAWERDDIPASVVYFIKFGRKVKIGTSTNPRGRYKAIRRGLPGKCSVEYVTPGDHTLERQLHSLFAVDRIAGEWFLFSQAIKDWIAADTSRRCAARI